MPARVVRVFLHTLHTTECLVTSRSETPRVEHRCAFGCQGKYLVPK